MQILNGRSTAALAAFVASLLTLVPRSSMGQVSCGVDMQVIDTGVAQYVICPKVVIGPDVGGGSGGDIVFTTSPGAVMGQGLAQSIILNRLPSYVIPTLTANTGMAHGAGVEVGNVLVETAALQQLQQLANRLGVRVAAVPRATNVSS